VISADVVTQQARLDELKAKVTSEGGELLAKAAVVGQDNTRLQDLLDQEKARKERLAEKRAERARQKKAAKGIVEEEEEVEETGKKGKKKNKKQDA
jgi:hypothetical protein